MRRRCRTGRRATSVRSASAPPASEFASRGPVCGPFAAGRPASHPCRACSALRPTKIPQTNCYTHSEGVHVYALPFQHDADPPVAEPMALDCDGLLLIACLWVIPSFRTCVSTAGAGGTNVHAGPSSD
jgi:hypothetical protein